MALDSAFASTPTLREQIRVLVRQASNRPTVALLLHTAFPEELDDRTGRHPKIVYVRGIRLAEVTIFASLGTLHCRIAGRGSRSSLGLRGHVVALEQEEFREKCPESESE